MRKKESVLRYVVVIFEVVVVVVQRTWSSLVSVYVFSSRLFLCFVTNRKSSVSRGISLSLFEFERELLLFSFCFLKTTDSV